MRTKTPPLTIRTSARPSRAPAAVLAAAFACALAFAGAPDSPAPPRNFSGWRGGIGMACENPSDYIRDVSELGYDICWTWDNLRAVRRLDLTVFKYWNTIVETNLNGKDSPSGTEGDWDFSQMPDKERASHLAFDAMFEKLYGVKGLSTYAKIVYRPDSIYKVGGTMDLSSDNPLVKAVEDSYIGWFKTSGISRGGIALDNAYRVPKAFMESLSRSFNPQGLGIATNGAPDEFLPLIDFFGYEGFPFSIDFARTARRKGLRGILGEFTMQHLSPGETAAYLKNKQFNGIVFFGYISSTSWLMGEYSRYDHRPDVYDHQRWVFRKYIPLVKAMIKAGRAEATLATLASAPSPAPVSEDSDYVVHELGRGGKLKEFRRPIATVETITGRSASTAPRIVRYGASAREGIYFFVDSGRRESVTCPAAELGIARDTIVFDEFNETVLSSILADGRLVFATAEGPALIQLANGATIVRNLLERSRACLQTQLIQRALDREGALRQPQKAWEDFCHGWSLDRTVARSGSGSLKTEGGVILIRRSKNQLFERKGAAQLVNLGQSAPERIVLKVSSMAKDVPSSAPVDLGDLAKRRAHFDARQANTYCVHLYLDYQDGQWPEVHTATFAPGTHGWEEASIAITPRRPVKTAQVVIEFQQPKGAAWFDDVVLTQGDSARNLIASGGFEESDPAAGKAAAIGGDYDQRISALAARLDACGASPTPEALASLSIDVTAAAALVENAGAAPFFGRELRDLDDVRGKLGLCSRILSGR